MDNKNIVKSLILLEESVEQMREDGDTDLRSIISQIEHLIMCIENK